MLHLGISQVFELCVELALHWLMSSTYDHELVWWGLIVVEHKSEILVDSKACFVSNQNGLFSILVEVGHWIEGKLLPTRNLATDLWELMISFMEPNDCGFSYWTLEPEQKIFNLTCFWGFYVQEIISFEFRKRIVTINNLPFESCVLCFLRKRSCILIC